MLPVTITLTRYKEPNRLLFETLFSLAKQTWVSAIVRMLDQHFDEATKQYCEKLQNERIQFDYSVIEPVWLSYARNYAIKHCTTDILLCIDADAIADEHRAYELCAVFNLDEKIGMVWGKILPKFHKKPPFLLQANFVYDMYSLLDNGDVCMPSSKIVWASYGMHLWRMWSVAYLDETLGRRPWTLLGGEETDLCQRVAKAWLLIYYTGKSVVHHQVLPERLNYKRIIQRTYRWWYSRGMQWGTPKANNTKTTIWTYISWLLLLPAYGSWYLVACWTKVDNRFKTYWRYSK